MKRVKPLTESRIKALKPKDKQYRVADGDGLYIYVLPTGKLVWRLFYTQDGKKLSYTIGKYPKILLSEARDIANDKIENIKIGLTPTFETKRNNGRTLSDLIIEYMEYRTELSAGYKKDMQSFMDRDVSPFLSGVVLNDLTTSHIIMILKQIEKRGVVTVARKVKKFLSKMFRYATTNEYMKYNPADIDTSLILQHHEAQNYPHTIDKNILKDYFEKLNDCYCDKSTKYALWIAPYVFVRPTIIRLMEWTEIDFEKKIWSIPKNKMKMKRDHIVPLGERPIKILAKIERKSNFVFPSVRDHEKSMSENTLNKAIARLGFKGVLTAHGFRHTASTILNENIHVHGVSSDIIEVQMAHINKNTVKMTYNKAIYLHERMRLMDWWNNYLDAIYVGD